MLIYNATGATGSGVLFLSKGVGSLLICTDLLLTALANEKINVEIERANGANQEITKGPIPLKDFILGTTFGEDAVTYDAVTSRYTAVCEIGTDDNAIYLAEGEKIKIELTGLDSTKYYAIYGMEEPTQGYGVVSFDRKSMGADDTTKDFDVQNYDLLVMEDHADITEVNFTFVNGVVTKHLPLELRATSRAIDNIAVLKSDGSTVQNVTGRYRLPLVGVSSIQVRKSQGTVINLLMRAN